MRRFTRTTAFVAVGAAVAVASVGIAYAYWTTSGSGSGTAATGTSSSITVKQVGTITGLAPGSGTQALAGKFDNSNPGAVYVHSVTVAVASTSNALCTAADFTVVQPGLVDANIPAGLAQGSWSAGSIAFNDDPARNQDVCKNVTVNLSFSSN
jgi:ABC-type glycerol-3-phosphate transport system substrate-binding protein